MYSITTSVPNGVYSSKNMMMSPLQGAATITVSDGI